MPSSVDLWQKRCWTSLCYLIESVTQVRVTVKNTSQGHNATQVRVTVRNTSQDHSVKQESSDHKQKSGSLFWTQHGQQ